VALGFTAKKASRQEKEEREGEAGRNVSPRKKLQGRAGR
jgi:hypothetical protein